MPEILVAESLDENGWKQREEAKEERVGRNLELGDDCLNGMGSVNSALTAISTTTPKFGRTINFSCSKENSRYAGIPLLESGSKQKESVQATNENLTVITEASSFLDKYLV